MKRPKVNNNSLFMNTYDLPYDERTRAKLYRCCKGNLDLVQRLKLMKKLPVHLGCVNTICWNETGQYLLSGSDDQNLVITNGFTYQVEAKYKTTHRANIFSAKFLPSNRDTRIVSCSGDGIILYTDLMIKDEPKYNLFNCHAGTTYEVATVPLDPNSFLSCGEDGTVRWYDLRIKEKCNLPNCQEDVLVSPSHAVTAIAINSVAPHQLAVGCADSVVRLYDRRMLSTYSSGTSAGIGDKAVPPLTYLTIPTSDEPDRFYRITSVCFSPEGKELLASYSSEHLYLFSLQNLETKLLKAEVPKKGPTSSKKDRSVSAPVRRLRLRGDWSDTGPDARPESEAGGVIGQARPQLHETLMERMTGVLSNILNDPATRAALSAGGEDSVESAEVLSRRYEATVTSPVLSSPAGEPSVSHQSTSDLPSTSSAPNSALHASTNQLASSSDGPGDPEDSRQEIPSSKKLCLDPEASSDVRRPTLGLQDVHSDTGSRPGPEENTEPQHDDMDCEEFEPSGRVDVDIGSSISESASNCSRHSSEGAGVPVFFMPKKTASENVMHQGVHGEGTSGVNSNTVTEPRSSQNDSVSMCTNIAACDVHQELSLTTDDPLRKRFGDCETIVQTARSVPMGAQACDDSIPETQCVQHDIPTALDELMDVRQEVGGREDLSLFVNPVPPIDHFNPDHHPPTPKDLKATCCSAQQNDRVLKDWAESEPSTHQSSSEADYSGHRDNSTLMGAISPASAEEQPSFIMDSTPSCFSDTESESNVEQKERRMGSDDPEGEESSVILQKYTGHRNARTMIKEATFWGTDYVMSGSDCGHVFIWERDSGRLVKLLEADTHVVNCLQPHPTQPLLATSGIDHDIKLWGPIADEPEFDELVADELVKRNAVMLKETRDTITVPASFMIRMLACLNQIRRGGVRRRRPAADSNES